MTTPQSALQDQLLGSQETVQKDLQLLFPGSTLVHEKHFTLGGMRPVPVAYRHRPQSGR